jgi:uncharacterized protein YwqG
MDIETLTKYIMSSNIISEYKDFILGIVKPSVDIDVVNDTPEDSCSRFGCHPFLPNDFQWPSRKIGEYRFLGQINFEEIINPPKILPNSGLLSLFYTYDESGQIFCRNDGYILCYFWDKINQHEIIKSKSENITKAKKIILTGSIDIPRHQDLRTDWPFDTDLLYDFIYKINLKNNYLLGYPSYKTFAFDPTPGPEWISLLTLESLDEFGWCWHDGDKLMTFIESNKLSVLDFSNIKCDAG